MSYDNPNFTIITSGGCNSFCSFCTDPFKRKADPSYLSNLVQILSTTLPAHFRQVSISGGEPTLSPDLPAILNLIKMSRHFDKVVFTTNGAKLMEHLALLKGTINHLNVSRHGIGYDANTKVFGTPQIISDEDLRLAAFELNKAGIDVNLNHVYTKDSKLTVQYVLDYIDYARSVGATSVSFRYDQGENSLAPTYLEELFSEWAVVNSGGCPVCRNHTVLVKGFPIVFKASFAEPSKAIDDVYELIYHITGKLTTDWEGHNEFTSEKAVSYVEDFTANPHKEHAVVAHTVAAPAPSVKGKKAASAPAVEVKPKQWTRADFDAVRDALCVREWPGRLTKGQAYLIHDTSTNTIDVQDDRGNFHSYSMDYFEPAEQTAYAPQASTSGGGVKASKPTVVSGGGHGVKTTGGAGVKATQPTTPSFGGGGCGSGLGGGCGSVSSRSVSSSFGGGCGYGGGCGH